MSFLTAFLAFQTLQGHPTIIASSDSAASQIQHFERLRHYFPKQNTCHDPGHDIRPRVPEAPAADQSLRAGPAGSCATNQDGLRTFGPGTGTKCTGTVPGSSADRPGPPSFATARLGSFLYR